MPQRRLHSLDALRGLAALAVVLWHWQHFFLFGRVQKGRKRAPMVFQSRFVLVAFFAVLIGLGLLSYRCFDRPVQAALRRRATLATT